MIARLVILIIAPPILTYAFISRLFVEMKSAIWFASNATAQEFQQVRAAWRAKSIRPEKW